MNTEPHTAQENFETTGVTLVSTAHAVHDTYTGFLPALLPVLIEKFALSNTTASLLSVFLQVPSLLQPLIGRAADRKNLRLLIVLSPTITGAAMSFLPIAPHYGLLALLLVLAGISSAALHATGPVLGSSFSGSQLGKGMSFWMVGGELGRAFGPLITVTAIGYFTIEKFPLLMIAGLLTSVFLYGKLKSVSTLHQEEKITTPLTDELRQMSRVMLPIMVLLLTRAMSTAALTLFLPTYLTYGGASLLISGAALTILQISGIIGSLIAGILSDRLGRRKILGISYLFTPLLILLFIGVDGMWQLPIIVLLGFFAIAVTPVIMAVVMENFIHNRSFANGIYMAASFIAGALSTLAVGLLSDLINMQTTFIISACLMILGFPAIFWLPKTKK